MQQVLRLVIAAFVAIALAQFPSSRSRRGGQADPAQREAIEGFIAAQKDMDSFAEKMQGDSDKPDPKMQAELETIAKKHGFASFNEYDDVAANISMVMAGIDPQSQGVHRAQRRHQEGDRRGQGRHDDPREGEEADARGARPRR